MEEATIFRTAKQLRGLFVTLILDGAPSAELWETFRAELIRRSTVGHDTGTSCYVRVAGD